MARTEPGNDEPAVLGDGTAPATPQDLFARLDELGIAHKTMTHEPFFTVEDSKALRGEMPGGHIKNLFLRNKKKVMWLVVCHEDRQIDLKWLGDALGAGRFSFGRPARLMSYLGVSPGAVTPFAVINDHERAVRVAIDQALLERSPIHCHPLVNHMTTAIACDDLLRFLESEEHSPRLLDLGAIPPGPG